MNTTNPLPVGTRVTDRDGFEGTINNITHHAGSFWYDVRFERGVAVRYASDIASFKHSPDARRMTSSPWGAIEHVTQLAEGIWIVETSSHGGIFLSDQRMAEMPVERRKTFAGGNWFEEDCDWALVAITFTDAFKDEQVEQARAIIRQWRPEIAARMRVGGTIGTF